MTPAAPHPSAEPALRVCHAPDGVRLAMAVQGQGPVVVKAAQWLSHLQQEPLLFATRHWVAELSRANTLVSYDSRGCGLSDRNVPEVSLQAWVADLEAVVEAAAVERFVLVGVSQGAAVAIEYAARHPQRVQGLVLIGAFARGMLRQGGSARVRQAAAALIRLAELGWGQDTQSFRAVFTQHMFGQASAQQMAAFDACHRHTVSGPVAAQYMRAFYDVDVCDTASRLRCPTLVLHSDGDGLVLPREGRLLAALIPGARFVALRSDNHVVLEEEPAWPVAQQELRSFLAQVVGADPAAAAVSGSAAAAGAAHAGAALPAPAGRAPSLTPRQQGVLLAVARGRTDKEIARQLNISPRTVEMHVARALRALGARNRAEAVSVAMAHQLLA